MASSFVDTDTVLKWLLDSAQAIEDGNLKRADAFLQLILILADETPDKFRVQSRVVKYFAEALVRRAYGLHPASSNFTFPVNPAPYLRSRNSIDGVIKKVIDDALMGNRRLHLIDFSIPRNYCFEDSVLCTLPNFSGDPLPVRVSYILPPFQAKYVLSSQMEFLTRDAREVNVKLEDEPKVVYANSLAEVGECEIDFKRSRDDEMVVVYYKFKLEKLVRDAKAMERELVRLKEINPTIVIMLDFYSNHTHSNFLTCFKDSFQYSLKTLDCWAESEFVVDEYKWELSRDVGEGNNVIRGYQTLSEWQRLFSMAGFTRIPLNHNEDNLGDESPFFGSIFGSFSDTSFLEIMREEEECLILGNKRCPMFFLSAWKPKVEDGHFNSFSTDHKFGQGFNPNPSPRQPFPEDLVLNRLAALAEIHDILEDLCCKHKLPLALTWASRVSCLNETISDSNKKHTFFIQSNSCYVTNQKCLLFMEECEFNMTMQPSFEKALESSDGYHFHSSTSELGKDNFINIDDIVTVCLQNRYTRNDIYVVEFYWPTIKIEKSKSLALRIFNDLKHKKTKFVAVKIQGTEIGSQKEAISNISTLRCLQAAEETEEVQAVEINGVDVERGVDSNFPSPMPTHSSSKVVAAPFNTPEGPHNQIVPNDDPEIGKANKEKLPRTKQRNSRPKTVKANKEKLPETTQRRLTSAVWEHFDRLLVGGEQVAKCKHCPKVLTGSSNSGTTHLRNHLNVCQKEQNQERSRLNFVKMIIKHRYPLDMADQEFFKNFVKDMQPMFEFESKDISSYIRSIYREEKEKLQLYFNKLASKFNLTVSLWKNNSGKTAYCCLIAHFIDDSWELKMKTLGLRTLEHINDTKAVGGIIQSLVSEWNIGSKVCSITVDNSFLDNSMVQQIKDNCLSNLVSLSSTHWFINCTLLEDGFREMDDLLFNLKKSIEYVTETKHGRLKFQEAVDQVKLHDGKSWDDLSLKLESDFGILDSALRSREIFCKLEQIDGNFKLNPSMEEWENAAALQSCLRCFDDIKGTQSLTVSLYLPQLCDIYKKFLQLEKSNPSFVTLMKRRLCNSALAVASVLDPRLKFKVVEFSYILIYGHDSKVQLNTFRELLTNVYNEYANETKNQTTSASVLDDINWLGNNSIWDSFSKFVTANEASSKSELELYLDEPLLPMDGEIFDILGWWCDKSQKFPILAKMARDFLAIPVSIFTPCSNIKATINNPAYNILNPESMEALVCSENWLESPKGNDGENHEPTQTTDKGKRKLDEDTCVGKKSKPSNCEKDIAKDSNSNDEPVGEISIGKNSSKNGCYGETSSGNKSKASNKMDIHQEKSSSEFNHGRNVEDVSSGESSSDNDQSDQLQSSSSESDVEITLKEQGSWFEQDIKAYLLSEFTKKENELIDKWQKNELKGKRIGRDKCFKIPGEILAPLLMVPQGDETRKEYYIEDLTQLIEGPRTEQEVLAWVKVDELRGVHKMFLPMSLSKHWVLFYADTKEKKISWLDPIASSRVRSYNVEKDIILQWFTTLLLPKLGYVDAKEWPFLVRNDIPEQKNSVDCAVFVMKYGDCLTHGDCFPFKQEDMVHFRRRIFVDIYRGRIH
ncbi:uncharacterized protein LOC105796363 isoform X2 [Gossypium raimondii]|uniref:uncharacterized protein LOC105796363 isoform X2 n=1 Tax=Gossypium raimondii TaxID=29730 RepID=UPI00227AAF6F|nr:uncharacterized protein LOC105796363 isoform X2 [Gossypium raimondii]